MNPNFFLENSKKIQNWWRSLIIVQKVQVQLWNMTSLDPEGAAAGGCKPKQNEKKRAAKVGISLPLLLACLLIYYLFIHYSLTHSYLLTRTYSITLTHSFFSNSITRITHQHQIELTMMKMIMILSCPPPLASALPLT
jgi:hypothetical protein